MPGGRVPTSRRGGRLLPYKGGWADEFRTRCLRYGALGYFQRVFRSATKRHRDNNGVSVTVRGSESGDHGSALAGLWRTSWASGIGFFYVCLLISGTILLVVACWSLANAATSADMRSALSILSGGIVFLVTSVIATRIPATCVELYDDGMCRIMARRKTLVFGPGDLLSVRAFPLDCGQLMPMRVTSRHGTIWIHTRMNPPIESLFKSLRWWNPEAVLDRLNYWW